MEPTELVPVLLSCLLAVFVLPDIEVDIESGTPQMSTLLSIIHVLCLGVWADNCVEDYGCQCL